MIRVVLASHSRLGCDSLRKALDEAKNIYVVGCATTAEELFFLLPHSNVVVIGTDLKDASAYEILEEMRITHPQVRVLVMGVGDRQESILRYVESGAAGYILQHELVEDMIAKLHAVHNNKAIISPTMAAALMERLRLLANLDTPLAFTEARKSNLAFLTKREREILCLIAGGHTNQQIADKLVIEYGTVKNHVHNILRKLEVNNRHEAASVFQMHQQPQQGNNYYSGAGVAAISHIGTSW